jgi:LacI family transcriptional regulator
MRIRQVDRMNAAALAEALHDIGRTGSSGVAFQALDHPLVTEAVEALRVKGVPTATVVSGISSSLNLRYVGLDNRGAGRTAAFLLGSFLVGAGRVAVVWSGSLSRAHEERESGFRAFLRDEFPEIEVVDVNIGRNEPVETLNILRQTLGEGPGYSGVYCLGAGLASLINAVSAFPNAQKPKIIGHNLTENTREHLMNRSITAIIHQDMARIAEEVVAGLADAHRVDSMIVPTIVVTRENLNQYLDLASLRPVAAK